MVFLLLACMLSQPLHAATAPNEQLKQTLKELTQSKAQQRELDEKIEIITDELEASREDNIAMAKSIRAKEDSIAEKTQSLNILESEYTKRTIAYHTQKDKLSRVLYGILRMQRLPRQFVIARPGNPDDLLRTASALQLTYKAADESVALLQTQLEELQKLQAKVTKTREQLQAQRDTLLASQDELLQEMKERQRLQKALFSDHQAIKNRIATLSKESTTTQELIDKLGKDTALFAKLGAPAAKPAHPSAKPPPSTIQASSDWNAQLAYPASGTVTHRYGEKRASGEKLQGMIMQTGAKALVTTPFSGKVAFTGTFMEYGNMIIIQKDNDHHMVLAGFDAIKVEPGQAVAAGEPIGVMGNTPPTRELYLEMRKHSKAIDPSRWMSNVSIEAKRP